MMGLAFKPPGPYTPPAIPTTTLESYIGHLPATLNMLPGFNHDGKTKYGTASDFSSDAIYSWDVNARVVITKGFPGIDGQNCCQKIAASASAGTHQVAQNGNTYTISHTPHSWRAAIIAKPAGLSRAVFDFINFGIGGATLDVGFDFAGGNANYSIVTGAPISLIGSVQMVPLANGFYLGYFDFFLNSSVTYNISGSPASVTIFLDNGTGTAAPSTSFTGDGTSGLQILLVSLLPTVLWTKFGNTPVFEDEFHNTGTIDLSDTRAPGYNWYTHNLFTNSVYSSFGWATNPPSAPTPGSNFSTPAESILLFWSPDPVNNPYPGWINQFWSIATDGGNGYIGQTWPMTSVHDFYAACSGGMNEQANLALRGDGASFFRMSIGSFVPYGRSDSLNPLNDGIQLELDSGGYPFSGGSNAPYSQGITHNEFIHWHPTAFNSSQLGVGGVVSFDARATYQYNRQTNVWLSSFADPNAIGWGAFLCFQNGNQRQFCNSFYARNLREGQTDWMPMPILWTNTDLLAGNPTVYNNPPGGQQFYLDWIRVYQPTVPLQCYNLWDAFDADAALVVDNTAMILTKTAGAAWASIRGSGLGKASGLWYWEITVSGASVGAANAIMLGVMNTTATVSASFPGGTAKGAGLQSTVASNTNVSGVTGKTATAVTWANGDRIGFALDLTAGIVYVHKNGTYINGNPGSGNGVWGGLTSADHWYPAAAIFNAGVGNTITANFGATTFSFAVPTGYTGWTLPP